MRQAPVREHVVVETREPTDTALGHGEDQQPGRMTSCPARMEVGAERGLPVGASRYQVIATPAVEYVAEESGNGANALIFQRDRRHRDSDVGGEQFYQGLHVAGLIRADEPGDQLALRR